MKKIFKAAMFSLLAGVVGAQAAEVYGAVSVDEVEVESWVNGQLVKEKKVRAVIDGDSYETIDIPTDIVVDSVEYNRTFKPNVTSTFMLPFSIVAYHIAGGNFFKLTDIRQTDNNGSWRAYAHETANTIEANVPYIVRSYADKLTFTFHSWGQKQGVLNTTTNSKSISFGDWTFYGSYDYKKWEEGNSELGCIYGFAAKDKADVIAGEFVRGKAGAYVRPTRAYLKYTPKKALSKASAEVSQEEIASLPESIEIEFLDEEGGTLGVGRINTITGEVSDVKMNRWYDLNGRKLNGKPTTKGTYYNNRQKVIIK